MKGKCLLILFPFLGPPILEKLKLDIVSAMPQGEGKSKSLKGQIFSDAVLLKGQCHEIFGFIS